MYMQPMLGNDFNILIRITMINTRVQNTYNVCFAALCGLEWVTPITA